MPSRLNPSSGTPFHSLHATSQALQPMQTLVSVKKPIRRGGSAYPDAAAGLAALSTLVPFAEAGPAPVVGEVRQQRPAGRPPARLHVAGTHLALLDQHVRIQRDAEQVVGRVTGDEPGVAPVVRPPHL